jgi:ribosomal protein S18 acetylase RimI-like enzyme
MNLPEPVTIRPATPADLEALGRLGALLVRVHHEFDRDRFIAPTPRTEGGYGGFLAGQLKRKDVVVLVAEEAGAAIGYTYAALEGTDWLTLRGPAGVIYDLMVDPEHRRRGVGRRLLEETFAALQNLGARQVLLSTAERNGAARRLFASAGFRPTMIEMTRELPG